jgi:hypothetical protein
MDASRFRKFAYLIRQWFPNVRLVADIAGGKGHLSAELAKYDIKSVTFDKRNRKQRKKGIEFRKRFFNSDIKTNFDLLVGMHPDEATDLIIYEAKRRRLPFMIVPCCVLPNMYPFDKMVCQKDAFGRWVNHLVRLSEKEGFKVFTTNLDIKGKNMVIIGKPILK